MTPNDSARSRGTSILARTTRSRSARFVAGTMAVGLTVGVIATSGGGAAGAATTYSTAASGRFLSGTIAGLSLDKVAGIEGESAANKFGPTVTHSNSLKAELLNKAIEIPLQDGLQLPGLDVLHLGAVSQYAQATPTGAALGASGAVDSNGGVGVGGTPGAPTGTATLDLSGLGGGALAKLINVKATIGAITARAIQAAGANGKQTGEYNIAGLDLELDLPILANLLPTVLTPVNDLLGNLGTALNVAGLIHVPSFSAAVNKLETLSLPETGKGAGAISINLKTGVIKVSVEKLLQSLNLDINNLPPNTSLVPYIVKALAGLPAALGDIASSLVDTITGVVSGITIAGLSLKSLGLDKTLNTLLDPLLTTLSSTLTPLVNQLKPVTDLLASLLNIVVNGQSTSGGVFTETAVQLKIGGALSGLNSTVAGLINTITDLLNGITPKNAPLITKFNSGMKAQAKKVDLPAEVKSAQAKPANKAPSSLHQVKLISAVTPVSSRVLAAAPTSNPLIELDLARAAVGPSTPKTTSTSPAPPSVTPTTSVPATNVPTGVPAGEGTGGGTPELPLILVLLTLLLGAGGVATYRFRGGRASH